MNCYSCKWHVWTWVVEVYFRGANTTALVRCNFFSNTMFVLHFICNFLHSTWSQMTIVWHRMRAFGAWCSKDKPFHLQILFSRMEEWTMLHQHSFRANRNIIQVEWNIFWSNRTFTQLWVEKIWYNLAISKNDIVISVSVDEYARTQLANKSDCMHFNRNTSISHFNINDGIRPTKCSKKASIHSFAMCIAYYYL